MRASGGLTPVFGWLVPPGPGAGMGLLIFFSSLGGILAGLVAIVGLGGCAADEHKGSGDAREEAR